MESQLLVVAHGRPSVWDGMCDRAGVFLTAQDAESAYRVGVCNQYSQCYCGVAEGRGSSFYDFGSFTLIYLF